MNSTHPAACIAITMGDAAGIGPEIIAKAYALEPALLQGCFVVGDLQTLRRANVLVALPHLVPAPICTVSQPEEVHAVPLGCIPVLEIAPPLPPIAWGQAHAQAGAFAGQCVMWAAQAALQGRVQALVTAPLHKAALHAGGAPWSQYPGHTEMLQAAAAQYLNQSVAQTPVRMMLANGELRTVLVSIHVSLRHAIDAVTYDNVLQTIHITHQALSPLLGRAPHIAVAGLNPHAGEDGLFGSEEITTIAPAVAAARALGCKVSGPWAPDTVFMRARAVPGQPPEFDVVVAMYHDQGLIPVKYLGIDQGTNVTLGLPFIRTSPDHGTAWDIAGQGRANPSSFLEAVRTARHMFTAF